MSDNTLQFPSAPEQEEACCNCDDNYDLLWKDVHQMKGSLARIEAMLTVLLMDKPTPEIPF